MGRALVVSIVGLAALILGIVIAGQPREVPNDVVSSRLQTVTSPTSTTVGQPATSARARATTVTTTTTTRSTLTSTSTSTSTSAPAPPALLPESSVRVVVANATNVSGVAARTVEQLRGFGYVDVGVTDAVVDRPDSTIVYVDGRSGEALRLAAQIGLDPSRVQPRQAGQLTVTQEAGDILVLIGGDRA